MEMAIGGFAIGTVAIPSSPARSATVSPPSLLATTILHGSQFTLSSAATPSVPTLPGSNPSPSLAWTGRASPPVSQGTGAVQTPNITRSGRALPGFPSGSGSLPSPSLSMSPILVLGSVTGAGIVQAAVASAGARPLPANHVALGSVPSPTVVYSSTATPTTPMATLSLSGNSPKISSKAIVSTPFLPVGATYSPTLSASPRVLVSVMSATGLVQSPTVLARVRPIPSTVLSSWAMATPAATISSKALPAAATGTISLGAVAISGQAYVQAPIISTSGLAYGATIRVEATTATPVTLLATGAAYPPLALAAITPVYPVATPGVGSNPSPTIFNNPIARPAPTAATGSVYSPSTSQVTLASPPVTIAIGESFVPTFSDRVRFIPSMHLSTGVVYSPTFSVPAVVSSSTILTTGAIPSAQAIFVSIARVPTPVTGTMSFLGQFILIYNTLFVTTVSSSFLTPAPSPKTFVAKQAPALSSTGTVFNPLEIVQTVASTSPAEAVGSLPPPITYTPSRVMGVTVAMTGAAYRPSIKRDASIPVMPIPIVGLVMVPSTILAVTATPATPLSSVVLPSSTPTPASRLRPSTIESSATLPAPDAVPSMVMRPAPIAGSASILAHTYMRESIATPLSTSVIGVVPGPYAYPTTFAHGHAFGFATIPAPLLAPGSAPTPTSVSGSASVQVPTRRTTSSVTASTSVAVGSEPAVVARAAVRVVTALSIATGSTPAPLAGRFTIVRPGSLPSAMTIPSPTIRASARIGGVAVISLASNPDPLIVTRGVTPVHPRIARGWMTIPVPLASVKMSLSRPQSVTAVGAVMDATPASERRVVPLAPSASISIPGAVIVRRSSPRPIEAFGRVYLPPPIVTPFWTDAGDHYIDPRVGSSGSPGASLAIFSPSAPEPITLGPAGSGASTIEVSPGAVRVAVGSGSPGVRISTSQFSPGVSGSHGSSAAARVSGAPAPPPGSAHSDTPTEDQIDVAPPPRG